MRVDASILCKLGQLEKIPLQQGNILLYIFKFAVHRLIQDDLIIEIASFVILKYKVWKSRYSLMAMSDLLILIV